MKKRYAILLAQGLSYSLIITFLFADSRFNFTGPLRASDAPIQLQSAYIAACLVGIVGAISAWTSWYYMSKSTAISEMLTLCAWTHRVKTPEGWVSLEKFLSQKLGFAISHGLSDEKSRELLSEIDLNWKTLPRLPKSQPTSPQQLFLNLPLPENGGNAK